MSNVEPLSPIIHHHFPQLAPRHLRRSAFDIALITRPRSWLASLLVGPWQQRLSALVLLVGSFLRLGRSESKLRLESERIRILDRLLCDTSAR